MGLPFYPFSPAGRRGDQQRLQRDGALDRAAGRRCSKAKTKDGSGRTSIPFTFILDIFEITLLLVFF